eukprot:GHVS01050829.1.p1 GENE.GHVS01050829.1~~GHVS01050829.1.p1  ORF type:complete len:410 (-),score=57.21 GHVS01050829.1:244-1473(-)
MKVLKRYIEKKNSGGAIVVIAEESEDLWHLYNLVVPGDKIRAATFRKIQREDTSGTVQKDVKRTNVTLAVKSVDYDTAGDVLRVSGQNAEENPYLSLGQHHTLEVGLHSQCTIHKGNWDFVSLERLQEASDPHRSAEVAVLLVDSGVASLYLITSCLAKELFKIQVNIPRRRAADSGHHKAQLRFYGSIMNGLVQHLNFDVIKCCCVAGPAFTPEEFLAWMFEAAVKQGHTIITKNKQCFITAKASTAYKQSLSEVMTDPTIQSKIASTKGSLQVRALDEFYKTLQNDPDRACYGPNQVAYAIEQGAVRTLLVTDGLFRSSCLSTRRKYVKMTETVKDSGSTVHIVSDMQVCGEQLSQLTGIAALLRYPMPNLEDIDEEGSSSRWREEEDNNDDDLVVESAEEPLHWLD